VEVDKILDSTLDRFRNGWWIIEEGDGMLYFKIYASFCVFFFAMVFVYDKLFRWL